jgi:hypothetical protein
VAVALWCCLIYGDVTRLTPHSTFRTNFVLDPSMKMVEMFVLSPSLFFRPHDRKADFG